MNSTDWLQNGFILFGGFLAVLLSATEFFSPPFKRSKFLFASALFSIGVLQLSSEFILEKGNALPNFYVSFHTAFLFLPAPLAFLCVKSLSHEADPASDLRAVSLLVGLPFLSAFLYAQFSGLFFEKYLPEVCESPECGVSRSLYCIAAVFSLVFAYHILRMSVPIRNFRVRTLLLIFAFDTCIVSVLVILGAIVDVLFFKISLLIITLVVCSLFVLGKRYPDLADNIRSEFGKTKYARTRLAGLNSDSVLERLNFLLDTEKIYRNEGISLAGIAKDLSITPHQLSELINQKLNQGFFSLINGRRIEEAKILLAETDKTVLEIAYEVGFNNRSSFNESFLKFADETPVSYRKKYKYKRL
ncbi:AraC family transcriptional regulator [Leptospira fletcheri]|uniref:AraC family transcriptional regulator n=1 Tax=Leptospira fletcheri TaxID=2484981 RepID=A0A4V3JDU5_9LEPT|nr:helix-turn-helix transcriptional regulator [Leptospira fletcheri]TGK12065.1 AraC family transcriptional regulator [Leptospira fletcheri]